MHDIDLISTVALGLVFAWVGGMIAQRLRLSPLLGYLMAGVLLGPHTGGFHADPGIAAQLAELGIMLLMFGVGLHFSIADLWRVRAVALPGAVLQMTVATVMGIGLAMWWGWSFGAGLVFGLALSVASTVVLLRALEERNLVSSGEGQIAVGWLIVEDLAMVIALVVLPVLAPAMGGTAPAEAEGNADIWAALALTILKVSVFAAAMLIGGRRLVPFLLAMAARTGSRELFTLAVLAIALGIAFGSSMLFGISFALGAFFAGVVLAESDLSHQAAAESLPLQDAFAVLFFVSVGMLFDPAILVQAPLAVLVTVLVIVVGKSLAAALLVLALGHPLRTAATVSGSLAQIGEFSFILAGLGVTLGLLPEQGRDLVLAGALISIGLNPVTMEIFRRFAKWAGRQDGFWNRDRSGLSTKAATADTPAREHAVLVGFGRVGRHIARSLTIWEMPFTVIERDRRIVEKLRAEGIEALFGDASAPGLLDAAGIGEARLLIVTSPDGFHVRRILELARRRNPEIDTVVRTHSDEELEHLLHERVGLAVMAERELALRMTGYALRAMGLSEGEAQLFTESARGVDLDGAAGERSAG